MSEKVKQIVTLVVTFAGVLFPAFGAFRPGSTSTGEISDRYFSDVYIIPADYAFAIWAPIYLGFLFFAVVQALPAQRDNPRFAATRLWLAGTALLNAAWGEVTNNLLFGLSALVLVAMLVVALVMHRTMQIGRTKVYGLERLLRLPFSLYAGWCTVATILNVGVVLAVNGWDGFGISYPVWGALMLVVAAVIMVITRFRWRDPVVGGVLLWACVGIVLARADVPIVAGTAGVVALVAAATLVPGAGGLLRPRRRATA